MPVLFYAVKDTGGVSQHNLSHTHSIGSDTVSISSGGSHSHSLSGAITDYVKLDDHDPIKHCASGSKDVGSEEHRHWVTGNTSSGGDHSSNSHNHSGKAGPELTTPIDKRPLFYALCFIMKL